MGYLYLSSGYWCTRTHFVDYSESEDVCLTISTIIVKWANTKSSYRWQRARSSHLSKRCRVR